MWTNYPVIICMNRVQHSSEALGELGDSVMPWVSPWAEGTLTRVHPALPDPWGITQIRSWSCAHISIPLLKYPTCPLVQAQQHLQGCTVRAGSPTAHAKGGERAAEFTFPGLAVDMCPESEDIGVSFLSSLLLSWATQQTAVLSPPVPQATTGTSHGKWCSLSWESCQRERKNKK